MSTYRIPVISLLHSMIVTLVMLPVTAIAAVFLFPTLHVFSYLIQFFMLYLVITRLSSGETEWQIHPAGVRVQWTRQFLFASKADLDLSWEEIRRFDPFDTRNGRGFDLWLANGKKLRFYTSRSSNEDYEQFLEDFDYRFGSIIVNRPPEFID